MNSNLEPWSYNTHKALGQVKKQETWQSPKKKSGIHGHITGSLGILKVSSLSVQTKAVSQWSVGTPAKVILGGSELEHFNFEEASRTVFDLRTEGAVYP